MHRTRFPSLPPYRRSYYSFIIASGMVRIVRRLDGIIYLEMKATFGEPGRMDRQHDMDVLIFVLSLKDTTVAITSTG